jgi:hypothetical protein
MVVDLTPRQRQILDYLAAYLADEGYLPTTREIAGACALRSPTSVRRALQAIESAGCLVRDPDHPRLATVVVPDDPMEAADVDIDHELAVCELILVEMEAAVEAARRGLADAPDLDAQELAHREALERIRLLRIYADVRDRLEMHGAQRSRSADAAVQHHRELVAQRLHFIDSWDAYCLSTFILRLAVRDFVAQPVSGEQRHLRHAYAAEVFALDPSHRPDLPSLRQRLLDGDRALESLLGRYGTALHDTIEALAPSTPALATTPIGELAVQSLDTALRQLPAE